MTDNIFNKLFDVKRPVELIHFRLHFYEIAYVITVFMIITLICGCDKNQILSDEIPSVNTKEVTDITMTEVMCGGEVANNDDFPIIAVGVCWSESSIPTVSDHTTSDEIINGRTFLSKATNLNKGKIYYMRAYARNSNGIGYGNIVSFKTLSEQEAVSTESVTDLTDTEATISGKLIIANSTSAQVLFEFGTTLDYGKEVMTIKSVGVQAGDSIVNVTIENLMPGTTYHYRLKVITSSDTIYGNDRTFNTLIKDADGNLYHVIQIGNQTWMRENLRTTRYSNGELIGTTSNPSQDISGSKKPQYQWPCTIVEYGRFYTFYTITDNRGICPTGWHIPSDEEWTTLMKYLSEHDYGFEGNPQKISKSLAAQTSWIENSAPGTVGNDQESNNESGFTGLGTGGRYSNGTVEFIGEHGIWWSSTETISGFASFRCIGYIPGIVFRGHFDQSYGLAVRCVKDQE